MNNNSDVNKNKSITFSETIPALPTPRLALSYHLLGTALYRNVKDHHRTYSTASTLCYGKLQFRPHSDFPINPFSIKLCLTVRTPIPSFRLGQSGKYTPDLQKFNLNLIKLCLDLNLAKEAPVYLLTRPEMIFRISGRWSRIYSSLRLILFHAIVKCNIRQISDIKTRKYLS